MSAHYPELVIVIPLVAAFLVLIAALVDKRFAFPLAALALLGSTLTAITLLIKVMQVGVVEYYLAGWPPPVGIAYRVDHLNSLVLVVVSAVPLLTCWAPGRWWRKLSVTGSAPFTRFTSC